MFFLLALALALPVVINPNVEALRASSRVDDMLESMTLEQKIGQLLMPDFRQWKQEGEGAVTDLVEMNAEVAAIVDKYDLGGVILFANNVKATEQTVRLTSAYQDAAIGNASGNGNIPLLLTVDQEGGIVYRLGSGTALPGNMAIGATGSVDYARTVGEIIGREVSALGINVNFAPVLDTNNNPNNPVIGLRSISSDPNLVAKLGIPMLQGMQEYNVATSAKHFPGHGDTATDSHSGLPLVNKSYAQLQALELVPFQAAIDNGVDMLMTAHIQYPQIETEKAISKLDGSEIFLPATLSKTILTDIVRNDMGFEGIVITDAMNMDAISKNFGEIEATEMAISAGVDIVLMPTILRSKDDVVKLEAIITSLKEKAETDPEFMARIDESTRRVLELKEKRGILDYAANDTAIENKLANANTQVGSALNRSLERVIARDAVTVVKNESNILPVKVNAGEKVLMLAPYDNELPGMKLAINRMISEGTFPSDATVEYLRYSNTTTLDDLKTSIDSSNYVVVISEVANASQLKLTSWLSKMPTDIIQYTNQQNIESVLLSISKPYDTANYPAAKAVLAVYGNKGMDPTEGLQPDNAFGPNIPAGIEIIFGNANANGKLPVNIPTIDENHNMDITNIAYPLGFGLSYQDPVKEIAVSLPTTAVEKETFNTTIALGNMESLPTNDYQVRVRFDSDHFDIAQMTRSTNVSLANENTLIINKTANDVDAITIPMSAKQEGTNLTPIKTIEIVDAKGRVFSMGEDYYTSAALTINKKATTVEPEDSNKTTTTVTQAKKAVTTGDSTNTTVALLAMLIALGAMVIVTKKRKMN